MRHDLLVVFFGQRPVTLRQSSHFATGRLTMPLCNIIFVVCITLILFQCWGSLLADLEVDHLAYRHIEILKLTTPSCDINQSTGNIDALIDYYTFLVALFCASFQWHLFVFLTINRMPKFVSPTIYENRKRANLQ